MGILSSTLSPLPFYNSPEELNHKKWYAYEQIYPLVTYKNMLMPFQCVLSKESNYKAAYVINWKAWQKLDFKNLTTADIAELISENKAYDITANMQSDISLIETENYQVLKYFGRFPIAPLVLEGLYSLVLDLTESFAYSEVFTVLNNVDNYIELAYSNTHSFYYKGGEINFDNGFKFKCYLPTTIGKPEYEFEEVATERMGYTFIESQVSKKVYNFVFLAPEYLCDALRIVRLCDNKTIKAEHKTYELFTFSMNPSWEEQGDLAAVECQFETDTVVANIGGYKPEPRGDFNKDFNTDFTNS